MGSWDPHSLPRRFELRLEASVDLPLQLRRPRHAPRDRHGGIVGGRPQVRLARGGIAGPFESLRVGRSHLRPEQARIKLAGW